VRERERRMERRRVLEVGERVLDIPTRAGTRPAWRRVELRFVTASSESRGEGSAEEGDALA